jgi:glucarate dehydratase
MNRRDWLYGTGLGLLAAGSQSARASVADDSKASALRITEITITPIALPDPPLLAASGCHGPYFLRNIVELRTDAGVVGIGETHGGEGVTRALEKAREIVRGGNAFGYRGFARELTALSPSAYAGIELACLDACARASGRRICELLGGPVRDEVEFAAYLFYRYAADDPIILADPHLADKRGRGDDALDTWGEVLTPDTMAATALQFKTIWGFRVFKLKAGVLNPDVELATLKALATSLGRDNLLRIDPNGRWTQPTAIRIGKAMAGLPLEYYEDPVNGQTAMAEVRKETGLPMSTNMCVTSFSHIPDALRTKPIDVLLCDHHYFGGFAGCQALGPICDMANWRMSQHSNNHAGVTMAAMIHLAACIPQLTLASDTHYPWLVEDADIIEGPKLELRGGKMRLPEGPGLGVTLNRDRLARAHETYEKCGLRERNDGPLMRKLNPRWDGKPL